MGQVRQPCFEASSPPMWIYSEGKSPITSSRTFSTKSKTAGLPAQRMSRRTPGCEVMTNEQLGLDSNAKEAVAFAVLANEAMYGQPNNAPGATGAAHPVVMGKISQ